MPLKKASASAFSFPEIGATFIRGSPLRMTGLPSSPITGRSSSITSLISSWRDAAAHEYSLNVFSTRPTPLTVQRRSPTGVLRETRWAFFRSSSVTVSSIITSSHPSTFSSAIVLFSLLLCVIKTEFRQVRFGAQTENAALVFLSCGLRAGEDSPLCQDTC